MKRERLDDDQPRRKTTAERRALAAKYDQAAAEAVGDVIAHADLGSMIVAEKRCALARDIVARLRERNFFRPVPE